MPTAETARRRRRGLGTALVLAVCVAGLTGSWIVADLVDRAESRHAGQLMDGYADDASGDVTDEATRYVETLSDLAASVGAQSSLSPDDFSAITARVGQSRLPGVSGVVFTVPAADSQVAAVQSYWRSKGLVGLRLAPAGTGREHLFSVYVRTFDDVPPVHGRDLSRAAEAVGVMDVARDSGRVAASSTYVLLKDRSLPKAQRQLSFLLAAPVTGGIGTPDRGGFRGWMVMGVRGGDFVSQTLSDHGRDVVRVTLADVSDGPASAVVVASSVGRPETDGGRLTRVRTIDVGGRRWQLTIEPTRELLSAGDRRSAKLVLTVGTVMTLLLMALVGVLAGARSRALAQVDEATGALRIDIERRKATEARLRERDGQLQHLAFHDPLTGLANRTLFYDRTEQAIVRQNRTGEPMAVLFIDLDGFKQVNDDRGHGAGDAVLTEVGARLTRSARGSDTIARIGGDEFALLLERLTEPGDSELVATRVVAALGEPYEIGGGEPAAITGSVGVAVRWPGDGGIDELVHAADAAMYAAKFAGADRFVYADQPS